MRFILFFLLLITACSPLSQAQIDLPELPDKFSTEQIEPAIKLSEHWWTDFHDPQLNRLQQQLFSNNLDLRQALYRLKQLEALQKTSGAGLWPFLNLNGSFSRNRSPGIFQDITSTTSHISVAAGYEVDLWNKLKDKNKAAELRKQAGENEVQALLISLSAQLTEQYFLAVEQYAQLRLLEQQIDLNKDLLTTVTEHYRAGLATANELYQAQQNLVMLKTLIPQYQTTLIQAENSIALLLGQLPRTVIINRQQLPQLTTVIDIGLPADLLTRRPDVAAALLQLEAADRELAAALAERLPAINLTATLGHTMTQLTAGDIEGMFWNLALGFTQPLFDGGKRRAESDRQQALRAEQLAACRQTILTAIKEVETALIAEFNSTKKTALLEQQQQINLHNLFLTQNNYRSGLISSSDLLTSEIKQMEILSRQLSHQRQWLSDRITLVRALGGSWMTKEINQQRQTLNDALAKTN